MRFMIIFFTILIKILSSASEDSKYGAPEDFRNVVSKSIGDVDLILPERLRPFIEAITLATEMDEEGITTKRTLEEVEKIISPLEDDFKTLTNGDYIFNILQNFRKNEILFKKNEDHIDEYINHKKLNGNFTPQHFIQTFVFNRDSDDVRRYFVNSFFSSLKMMFNIAVEKEYDLDFVLIPSRIAIEIASLPQDVVYAYYPLNLQKMFFPFYFAEAFRACIYTCLLEHTTELKKYIDVRSDLKKPFIEAFSKIGIHYYIKNPKRLFEAIHFMTKNHIEFIPNEPLVFDVNPPSSKED
jgi:hypothetical protein